MAQVKFYSVSASAAKTDANGVYFVDGGELYKGTQRFGLGRVTVDASFNPPTSSKDGQAKGDIVVTGSGAGWVFDGTNWQSIGGDTSSLQSLWRSDISTWTAGLVSGGAGSYITGITQAADGKVTASAVAFPTFASGDAAGQVKLGNTNATVNGWADLVSDVEANTSNISDLSTTIASVSNRVTGIESIVNVTNGGTVTASSGVFTNLTVSDTADFEVTNIVASSLTVNGSTIEEIADSRIAAISSVTQTSTSTGITVSVTTSAGSVTAVSVDASAFGNVMKFRGVVASTAEVTDAAVGDIVVIGSNPGTGFVAGQEYICTAVDPSTIWELIGDQNTYALNAYSSTATVYTGAKTLPAAVSKAGAAIDALKTKTDAYVGGSASDSDQGVAVTVSVDASTLAPSVDVVVTSATLFGGLDASVSSSENSSIKVGVTQVDGKVTAVTADLLWLDANGTPVA